MVSGIGMFALGFLAGVIVTLIFFVVVLKRSANSNVEDERCLNEK